MRSFQIMLQATHGIVSGAPSFFRKAYGANVDEFSQLLWYPEKFLFNRNYYSEMDGKAELAEYLSLTAKLTQAETEELHNIVGDKVRKDLNGISALTKTKRVREVASFYEPLTKLQEHKIWTKAKAAKRQTKSQPLPAADEIVEDAGLAA